ncbi:MAG: hypothetical protein N0A24_09965 [Armatimonadetes bacterium]|nr:hypothetical protein [Armatimonadota bacterium]
MGARHGQGTVLGTDRGGGAVRRPPAGRPYGGPAVLPAPHHPGFGPGVRRGPEHGVVGPGGV